ncbi:MAG TPA: CPBP family intramembrane glutamic endopeptidase [Chitinophagaceae bacterium]|nr:CPBP family intramembrane glutamic endopeptidase [Chitinophagaceae bacterium]
MLGIFVQLALSWLIIWLFEKGNLSFLGLRPTKQRLFDFVLFLLVTAICCSTGFFMRMYFANEPWEINPALNAKLVLEGIWWNIKSVMFEELIFRGVVFYILIKKLGALRAIIISAIAFGIYHWFSFGVFGNIQQMIIIFFITGIMGLLYAYGYAKTFSLYIPIAIHFGWNFTHGFVFSEGNIGNGIFIQPKLQPTVTVSWLIYFLVSFLPMILALLINFYLLKRKKQAPVPNG